MAGSLRWYEEGALDPRPSSASPLETAAETMEDRGTRRLPGKAVLTVGQS